MATNQVVVAGSEALGLCQPDRGLRWPETPIWKGISEGFEEIAINAKSLTSIAIARRNFPSRVSYFL